jgi:hypothetical protein
MSIQTESPETAIDGNTTTEEVDVDVDVDWAESTSPWPFASLLVRSRREDRRSQRRTPIDVFANRFLDGYPYLCRATDISPDGMCLRRLQPEPTVTPGPRARFLGLQFQLPGSNEVLTASGEVVSHDDDAGTLGVRFTQLAPQTARALHSFLARVSVSQ